MMLSMAAAGYVQANVRHVQLRTLTSERMVSAMPRELSVDEKNAVVCLGRPNSRMQQMLSVCLSAKAVNGSTKGTVWYEYMSA